MATDYVIPDNVPIVDVRAIRADACSATTLNRVSMVIKSNRPSINFIALLLCVDSWLRASQRDDQQSHHVH
jgi:hypothetical protein